MTFEPNNLPFKTDNQTFFMIICYRCDFSLLKIALGSKNLDVNKKDGVGRNGLFYSLLGMQEEHFEVVKLLVDSGVEINCVDKDRNASPLTVAVEKGFNKIACFLLKNGASIDVVLKQSGNSLNRKLSIALGNRGRERNNGRVSL